MAFKYFVVCASVFLVQSTLGQFIPIPNYSGNSVVNNDIIINSGASYGNIGLGGNLANLGAGIAGLAGANIGSNIGIAGNVGNVVSSGPLTVTSISPIGPSGLAVASENVLEGVLTVSGQLPFLSAVAFEGPLPTSGSGVASCGCGSGSVGIVSEGLPASQALPSAGRGIGRGLVY